MAEDPPERGRPRGRALTPHELTILQLLLELQGRASTFAVSYGDRLEAFVVECLDAGASVRSIADALEVHPSQVQRWASSHRRRRQA